MPHSTKYRTFEDVKQAVYDIGKTNVLTRGDSKFAAYVLQNKLDDFYEVMEQCDARVTEIKNPKGDNMVFTVMMGEPAGNEEIFAKTCDSPKEIAYRGMPTNNPIKN